MKKYDIATMMTWAKMNSIGIVYVKLNDGW